MKKPKVSVQILNYNGKRFLKDCFDSLLKQNYSNFEIILVDNGSKDGSIEWLKDNYKKEIKSKKIIILKFPKNLGVAKGNNIAYRFSKADYALLLNSDTILIYPNFLRSIVAFAQKGDYAIIKPVAYPFKTKKFPIVTKQGALNVLGFPLYDVIKETDLFITGEACMLVRKDKIDYLFLDKYFAYGEDVFLCWRSKIKGFRAAEDRKDFFLHYGQGSAVPRSAFIRFNTEKNRIVNLLIFYETKTLFKIFPLLFFEHLIKVIYSLKYPKLFIAFYKAIFWDIKNIKFIIKQRKKIQKERKLSDKEIIKTFSYKIFPEHISGVATFLNKLSKTYCQLLRIKTYELSN